VEEWMIARARLLDNVHLYAEPFPVDHLATGGIRSECLLFPKADVQTAGKRLFSGAANGHKQSLQNHSQ
jgi:hypothetical protein